MSNPILGLFDKPRYSDYLQKLNNSFSINRGLINQELTGLYGNEVLYDMNHTLRCYATYEKGADFIPEGNGDYTPSEMHYKKIRGLVNKQARFLFSVPPDYNIVGEAKDKEALKQTQKFVDKVLRKCHLNDKLVKGARDCFIGKRIAIVWNFNRRHGITITVLPSLEFVYETDPDNVEVITKFIQFYNLTATDQKDSQRVYKKRWELKVLPSGDTQAWFSEGVYDGSGRLVEEITPETASLLKEIPARIIVNDGLSGDIFGVSDVDILEDNESYYSRLSNKDFDSIRKGADQITYTVDADPNHTSNFKRAPGAYWDIPTDPNLSQDSKQAIVGSIQTDMAYSDALDTTLGRIKADMYDLLDVPDVSPEALKGVVSSGKTLRAIYWPLVTRCNEKMLVWRPALEDVITGIIEGAKVYPEIKARYTKEALAEEYEVEVDNNYPLPDDEAEEKTIDLQEVNNKVRSRRSYMRKWYNFTEDEIEEELDQLMLEKQLLEDDQLMGSYDTDMSDTEGGSGSGTEEV